MPKESCYGCKAKFSNLSSHLETCAKAHEFYDGGIRRRINIQGKKKQVREALAQRKVEEQRAKAAAQRERLAARRAHLEAEREASIPVMLMPESEGRRKRRVPARLADLLPTSLKGLPDFVLKPRVVAATGRRTGPVPPPVPPAPASRAPSPRPRATVEDAPDEGMDGVEPAIGPPPSRSPLPLPSRSPSPPPINTPANRFGVFRQYTTVPQNDPEAGLTLDAFSDASTHLRAPPDPSERDPFRRFGPTVRTWFSHAKDVAANSFAPFLNWTTFKLMEWQYTGSLTKSGGELQRLVDEVILDDRFQKDDLVRFNVEREQRRLDEHQATGGAFSAADGWREASVMLHLPKPGLQQEDEEHAPAFVVDKIWVRSPLEVLKSAFQDISVRKYHWFPHRLFRRVATSENPNARPERLYTDVYNSDAMIREHEEVQRLPRNPDDAPDVEYVVGSILVYSDSTHLTNFGTASLWPIYAFFANLSKYLRFKPSMFAAHHLAYVPSLPDTLLRFYEETFGVPASAAVIRLLKYTLMEKVWLLLLDAEFMHAFKHGVLIVCGDGITRRVFPRIFMYLADYPEKCLVACLKTLARCACPDCTTDKCDFWKMGMKSDMAARKKNARNDTTVFHDAITRARRWIFEDGTPPDGTHIKKTRLGLFSMAPVRSAFSQCFADFGRNVYKLFVPDLMHEFELGVWKGTFTHLIRILIAAGDDAVQKLDERFSLTPTFGRATIRRFTDNISAMKKLAARDFEQMLKCAIPCFENLLPEPANSIVLTMLFELAMWHAFAKLQLHSESTITAFEDSTSTLGQAMRAFLRNVCSLYSTQELPKETQSRQRRKARRATAPQQHGETPTVSSKLKRFTVLNTPKYHRLGDYARSIVEMGTSDNMSTQVGEFEHRRVKQFYRRTNKNRTFGRQIALEVRRANIIDKIARAQEQPVKPHHKRCKPKKALPSRGRHLHLRFDDAQPLPPTQADKHYHVSDDKRYPVRLEDFLFDNEGDPACENFTWDLKTHLFLRLPGSDQLPPDYIPTVDDIFSVRIENDRLYRHKVLRVNYTTYDMRRDQDSINPRTHPDIMMLAPEASPHPYLYARVIGIFHVDAYHAGESLDGSDDTDTEAIQVLWVRWFDLDPRAPGGFKARRLPRLKWAALDDNAFGFVSPDQVLRAAYLMPAFAHGQSDRALPGYSVARREDEEDIDYNYHYVGIFADRDMFMRYYGGAVGHQLGHPGKPQPAPVAPEPITRLDGDGYDDEVHEEPEDDAQEQPHESDGEYEGQAGEYSDDGEEDGEYNDDGEYTESEDSEDDTALGPEDGETPMGHDDEELDRPLPSEDEEDVVGTIKAEAKSPLVSHEKQASVVSSISVSTVRESLKRKSSADTIRHESAPTAKQPRSATLEIGIPCIISSKKARFRAYARYIGEVEGELGPWQHRAWGGIRYFDIGAASE
ncbi:hypothetical protein BD310DRAFT_1036813 [Dichomitus squalens]|uniref:Uncharacterized protein n=1 Tax=Dichomitus squalens TaxID=114155 RepID=A0A4Q9Q4C8_9APHY|nr:hypothetical protein BD310DRAFT_1036813 [Dichomitus squalens]